MIDPERDAIILLYHGVTNAPSRGIENFSGKHLPVEEFDKQMAWISAHANPISLRQMAATLARNEFLPPRSVAVTFDDSFLNNRAVALPILERHGVPATFYVTTGFVGTNRRFWVDKVEHWLNRSDKSEIEVRLPSGASRFSLDTPDARIRSIVAIKAALKRMGPDSRNAALANLQQAADVGDAGDDVTNYANMSWDDVRALDASSLVDVGGHSVNHEILAYLSDDLLAGEIDGCLDVLTEKLGRDVDLFSYPEGGPQHYDERAIARLKARHVSSSPSAITGGNRPGADPFHLRRVMVGFMGAAFPFPDYPAFGASK